LIKRRHGFRDLTHPDRAEFARWLMVEAIGLNDGRVLLDRLISKLRGEKIVIPGVSVVERMAAEAMHAAFRASADGQAFYLGGPGEAGAAATGHRRTQQRGGEE